MENGWQCGALKQSRELAWSLQDKFVLIVLVFFRGFAQIMFGVFGSNGCDWLCALLDKVGLPGRDLIWISCRVCYAESRENPAT